MNATVLIILTALVSGLLTAGVAVFVAKIWWHRHLRGALDAKVDEVAELLREQVKTGVVEGLSESVNVLPKEVIRSTTRTVTQTGMDIVEEGISTLLGTKRPK